MIAGVSFYTLFLQKPLAMVLFLCSVSCEGLNDTAFQPPAGTRLTLKTGVKTQETKVNIIYLIRVFDTTWESIFWALKFLFLGQFFIFSY